MVDERQWHSAMLRFARVVSCWSPLTHVHTAPAVPALCCPTSPRLSGHELSCHLLLSHCYVTANHWYVAGSRHLPLPSSTVLFAMS